MAGKFGKFSKGEEKEKPTRYYSSLQEKSVAKAIGGKQTSNSGATMFQKGDVNLNSLFLIECKTKVKDCDSITVHKEWITKNREESIFMNKDYSAVAINFGPGQENYYIIDEDLFVQLTEYLQSLKQ